MPRIYRVMHEENGRPRTGFGGSRLGVRLPGGEARADVVLDEQGNVIPGKGGMSVVPRIEALLRVAPGYLPKRLRKLAQDPRVPSELQVLLGRASGSNSLRLWRMGEGPFADGPLTGELALRVDSPHHGHVEPRVLMSTEAYRIALEATREQWMSAEDEIAGGSDV